MAKKAANKKVKKTATAKVERRRRQPVIILSKEKKRAIRKLLPGKSDFTKLRQQMKAAQLSKVFIDCADPKVRSSIEKLAKSTSCLGFEIVETFKGANAIIVDSAKKWVLIESAGWDGNLVINTHQGDKASKHKKYNDVGVTYHLVRSDHVAIFVNIQFNVLPFEKKKKGYNKKLRKGKKH